LTPCCGFEVQKPTQALRSVKGPGNTFDLNPKWARTLPFGIYFSWDIDRAFDRKKLNKYPMKNITDLSAWVGFCTSSPQQGVKYRL